MYSLKLPFIFCWCLLLNISKKFIFRQLVALLISSHIFLYSTTLFVFTKELLIWSLLMHSASGSKINNILYTVWNKINNCSSSYIIFIGRYDTTCFIILPIHRFSKKKCRWNLVAIIQNLLKFNKINLFCFNLGNILWIN